MAKSFEELRDQADREVIASLRRVAEHQRERATREDRYEILPKDRARYYQPLRTVAPPTEGGES